MRDASRITRRPYEGAPERTLYQRGYLDFCDAAGAPYGSPLDPLTAAMVATYARLHSSGDHDQAEQVRTTLRKRGRRQRRDREAAELDRLAVEVLGPDRAVRHRLAHAQRAWEQRAARQLARVERDLFGEPVATGRRDWRRVHPGWAYPVALRARTVLKARVGR